MFSTGALHVPRHADCLQGQHQGCRPKANVRSVLSFCCSDPYCIFMCSGRVVTMECVEHIVKPDMKDPISGEPLKESDIIPLRLVIFIRLKRSSAHKYNRQRLGLQARSSS